jgi:hypothetical protein
LKIFTERTLSAQPTSRITDGSRGAGSLAPGRPAIEITATPCRHGPPLSHPLAGDVIGFALRWDGQERGAL